MHHSALHRIALLATGLALINFVGAPAILLCSWLGLSGTFLVIAATTVMVLTLALQIGYVVLQIFPQGRTPVAIPVMGPDAWLTVLISTALPGVLWHYLAALALPPMQLIMPSFVTPVFNVVLLLLARELQQRRSASLRV